MKLTFALLLLALSLPLRAQNNGGVVCTWPLPNTVVCCGPCACVVCSSFSTGDAGACIDMVLQCPNPQTFNRPLRFRDRLQMPTLSNSLDSDRDLGRKGSASESQLYDNGSGAIIGINVD